MDRTQEYRFIAFVTPLEEDVFPLDSFPFSEAIGSHFELELDDQIVDN